jgi:hypothetical protein
MISERVFASNFTSVWQGLTPTSEIFVRRINAGLYERVFPHLDSAAPPERRALINEAAFTLFVRYGGKLVSRSPLSSLEVVECVTAARRTIAHLDRLRSSYVAALDDIEGTEAIAQATRLADFFSVQRREQITFNPDFPGCGMIDACHGDVLVGGALYEVKAGDRRFRSVDIRQLLVYMALNYQARRHDIGRLGLFNPRTGVSFEASLVEFCFEVSGQAPPDLFADIVRAFSSGEMSR